MENKKLPSNNVTGAMKNKISTTTNNYINDIAKPYMKRALSNMFSDGVKMFMKTLVDSFDQWLFEDGQPRPNHGFGSDGNANNNIIDYSSFTSFGHTNSSPSDPLAGFYTNANNFSFNMVHYKSRETAEYVLKHMRKRIRESGYVSVANMYDIAGINYNQNPQLCKNGWTDLSSAEIQPIGSEGKFIIKLPKTQYLKLTN